MTPSYPLHGFRSIFRCFFPLQRGIRNGDVMSTYLKDDNPRNRKNRGSRVAVVLGTNASRLLSTSGNCLCHANKDERRTRIVLSMGSNDILRNPHSLAASFELVVATIRMDILCSKMLNKLPLKFISNQQLQHDLSITPLYSASPTSQSNPFSRYIFRC